MILKRRKGKNAESGSDAQRLEEVPEDALFRGSCFYWRLSFT
jgi:hypothetical protein